VAVIVMSILAAGPREHHSSMCLFCGARRSETWKLGVKVFDRVYETECSAWIRSVHPEHSDHIWSGSSTMTRSRWFGRTAIGCGGHGGYIVAIHYLQPKIGEEQARALLDRYHSELSGDPEAFERFLRADFGTLVTNANVTTGGTERRIP